MSEVTQAIEQRRSIRKYTEQDITPEVMNQLLEAVRWSPSWANTQCWEVVVVRDQAIKEQLQATLGKGNPGAKAIVTAPVVVVLCARLKESGYYKGVVTTKFGDWFQFDLGLACQNLCLAAHDLGIGSVVLGLFDQDQAAKAVKLPEGMELMVMIPLGYRNQDPKAPARKEVAEFTHLDTF